MKRLSTGLLPVLGLFALLMVSLYFMGDATQNATHFGRLYIWLLLLNTLFLAVLIYLIGINLISLLRQVIARQPGSRLTLRLMLMSVILAVVPVAIVYTFSIRMLNQGIDSWFDVRVDNALKDALELSRSSLDLVMRQLKQQTEPMVKYLADVPDGLTPLTLHDLQRDSGAVELTLFGADSRIIATSSEMSGSIVPRLPSDTILNLVTQGGSYVGLDPAKHSELRIRLVIPVPTTADNPERRYLQALYPLTDRIGTLAGSVEGAFGQYNELTYLRKPLKQSFILTLSLVLLLSALFAVWAAFYSSRRLMSPVSELAEGTKAVAAGEYHKRLPVAGKDDLGLLVQSFNQMTERLAAARDAADRSQRLVESQRAYLQTLLEHLSSGVMSLDKERVLHTVNAAASQILGLNLEMYLERKLSDLGREHPMLARFCETLEPLVGNTGEWQEQVVLFGTNGRKILICRGAPLPTDGDLPGGHVVVFDDITALVQAQRDAAWGDVARRLAHEIKNPLTPIQLSAERLRRKLLPQLEQGDADVVDRATHTIVEQVESMKVMVNAFGDYARPPAMQVAPVDLNRLILEVIELYRTNPIQARLNLTLDERPPHIQGDSVRIRQLLHNLIKNALEALEGREQGELHIVTRCIDDTGGRFTELSVTDNGPGFPAELMGRLFEPYVTSKVKGNGLGLAIVKKIVEEHGGVVWAENPRTGGASVRIRLLSLSADQHPKLEGDAA
jgi:nitrogen fixation/metabolism regulation signal transduction histidine kinase